jgi:hypothetical protein
MLLGGDEWFVTDVSGQRIGPISRVKMYKKKLGILTHEQGTDTLSRNYPSTLRNIAEDKRNSVLRLHAKATKTRTSSTAIRGVSDGASQLKLRIGISKARSHHLFNLQLQKNYKVFS